MAPGELDQHMRVLTGRWTIDFLAHLSFAAAFVSAAGITLDHGLTTSRSGIADTLNTAADSAQRVDSPKFERSSLMTIRSATALDLIITDDRLDPAVVAAFRDAGVSLQIVPGGDAEADWLRLASLEADASGYPTRMPSSRPPLISLLAVAAMGVGIAAPATAQAVQCPTNWKLLRSANMRDQGVRFGHLKVYRQPGERSVCAQATIRSGFRIDTVQIFSGKKGYAQRTGAKYVFYTLPKKRKRFRADLFVRKHSAPYGDGVNASL